MRAPLLLLAYFACILQLSAQVETETIETMQARSLADTNGWETSGYISLLGSQAYFNNWVAGGENSWAFTGLLNYNTRYTKDANVWDFSLNAGYGKILQGEAADWKKNDDKLELNGKYGHKGFSSFYYAGLVNIKTQFDDGFDYTKDTSKTSAFLSPLYGLGAIGLDYMPNKNISAFVSPASARLTFVADQNLADQGAYGVDSAVYAEDGSILTHGKQYKTEFGGYVRITAHKEIMKNIDASTKLDLYSNYLEKPENVDVDWEVMLTMKINEFFSANISTQLIYDDDIPIPADRDGDGVYESSTAAVQFKELFGIGINYKFK